MTADPFRDPTLPPSSIPLPDLPPPPMPADLEPPAKDDAPPKRPTTRAGRAAAAQAKKIQSKADKTPKVAKATPRRASLETRLTGSLTTMGTAVAMGGGMVSPAFTADGLLIVEHAASVAAALDKVAKDQPHVAAALEKMLTAGVYSGLIAAMLPLMVGIAANHGAIPPSIAAMLGTAPPEAPAGE